MRKKSAPFQYLLECSPMSLEDFELARLDRAANLRRQLRDIVEEWIDAEVEARLSHWVRENRRDSGQDASMPEHTPGAPNSKLALLPGSADTDVMGVSSTKSVHLRPGRLKRAALASALPPPVQISAGRRSSREAAPLAIVGKLRGQRNLRTERSRAQTDNDETSPDISRGLACQGRGMISR